MYVFIFNNRFIFLLDLSHTLQIFFNILIYFSGRTSSDRRLNSRVEAFIRTQSECGYIVSRYLLSNEFTITTIDTCWNSIKDRRMREWRMLMKSKKLKCIASHDHQSHIQCCYCCISRHLNFVRCGFICNFNQTCTYRYDTQDSMNERLPLTTRDQNT